MIVDQDLLRINLLKLLNFGMKLNSIAERVEITAIDLSRFKNGQIYLKRENAERLSSFLDEIKIPD